MPGEEISQLSKGQSLAGSFEKKKTRNERMTLQTLKEITEEGANISIITVLSRHATTCL